MADYYPLLARAVATLAPDAKEQRRSIYERARKALLGQLRTIDPPVAEDDVQRESDALDEAIARLEREIGVDSAVPVAAPQVAVKPLTPPTPASSSLAPSIPAPPIVSPPPARPTVQDAAPSLHPLRGDSPLGVTPRRVAPPAILATEDARAPNVVAPPIILSSADPSDQSPPVTVRMRTADAPRFDGPREGVGDAGKPEAPRPAAPRPEEQSGGVRRLALIAAAVALLFAGVGYGAWKMRDRPEDIVRARSPLVEAQPQQPAAGPKVNERISAGAAPTRPSELQPAERGQPAPAPVSVSPAQQDNANVAVGQRVGLLLQSDAPQGFDTQMGNVVWRMDSINRGPGVPLSRAIRADFDVPDAKLKGFVTIEKNLDPTLRASHTVTVRFLPAPDSPLAKITDIGLPVMRGETSANVEPLAGVQAKITDNIFIVALTSDPQYAVRNIETIKGRSWFDIPMKLADGRSAKITLEKGTPGERIVNEAFDAWSR